MVVSLIWYAFVITEVLSCVVGWVFLRRIEKKKMVFDKMDPVKRTQEKKYIST